MANDKIITVTANNFEQDVLNSTIPVLVDFWAEWCGPCRQVAPVLDALADEWVNRVRIAKLNIDDNPDLATRFRVFSIPTFILLKDGQEADRMMGAMPKSAFEKFLERNL